MKCSEYRQIASARLDGQATPEEARLLEAHLPGCEPCARADRSMRAIHSGLSGAPPAVSPAFRASLFDRLEAEGALPRRRGRLFSFPAWRWAAIPLAAAAGFALFVLVERDTGRQEAAGPVARTGETVPSGPSAGVTPSSASAPASPALPPAAAPVPTAAPVAVARPSALPDASGLTPEEAEIVANLDLLEQAESLGLPPEGLDDLSTVAPKGRG